LDCAIRPSERDQQSTTNLCLGATGIFGSDRGYLDDADLTGAFGAQFDPLKQKSPTTLQFRELLRKSPRLNFIGAERFDIQADTKPLRN
jgi:hypothetical protein